MTASVPGVLLDGRAAAALDDALAELLPDGVDRPWTPHELDEMRRRLMSTDETWLELAGRVHHHLEEAPHACLVRGLCTRDPLRTALVITCVLGCPVVPPIEGALMVHTLRPRPGPTEDQRLHTDGSEWPRPHDLTCLLCVRPDQGGGGRTRLLTVESVRSIVDRLPVEVQRAVRERRAWAPPGDSGRADDVHPECEPIVGASRVRWLREAVLPPSADPPASIEPGDSGASSTPLAMFAEALERAPEVVTLDIVAGDLLVVDNARCLHSRTAIADPGGSSRSMIRTRANRWK